MKKRPSSVPAAEATLAGAPAARRDYRVSMPAGYDTEKVVTLPLFKWQENVPQYLRIDSAIRTSKTVTTRAGAGGAVMKPAQIADVTDLSSGAQGQVIVGDVLEKRLNEEYPKAGYVGKAFAITQSKIEGKRYKGYEIIELKKK